MARVSKDTENQKVKSRAIILGLFPQFDDNQTLKTACIGRDCLIALDKLCTAIRQGHGHWRPEDQWSLIITLLSHALLRRIHAVGTSKQWVYGLKYDDFREAQKLRVMEPAAVSAMAKALDLTENADGIMMTRNTVLLRTQAKLAGLPDTSSLGSSASRQHSVDSEYDPVKQSRSPSAPPAPAPQTAAFERQLYKTYFDDPRMSDLKIRLSDRTIQVHRIVLCRASERFASLLEDGLQESTPLKLELHEDDPEAMMALLRYIYGLPYTQVASEEMRPLQHHALVSMTAEKYQVHDLQEEICEDMRSIIDSQTYRTKDFLGVLRTVLTDVKMQGSPVRARMISGCVAGLRGLKTNAGFLSMLREFPDLGVEIIGHQDL